MNRNKDFWSNVLKIFASGILAGVVVAASLPLLSHIFEPEQLGLLQVLISSIIILSGGASLRYEDAIILPKWRYQTNIIVILSAAISLVFSFLLLMCFFFQGDYIKQWLGISELESYFYIVPILVLFSSIVQIAQLYMTSKSMFNKLAIIRPVQTIFNNVSSVFIGYFSPVLITLVFSYFFSLVLSLFLSVTFSGGSKEITRRLFNGKLLLRYFKRYIKFPCTNLPMVLINNVSLHIPTFLITSAYGVKYTGLYVLANKILDLPLSLALQSLSQVFSKYAVEANRDSREALTKILINLTLKLVFLSIIVVLAIIFISDHIIDLVFGKSWQGVTDILHLLVFAKCGQLIGSSVSSTYNVIGKQEVALVLLVLFFVLRISFFYMDFVFLEVIKYYSYTTCLYYLFSVIVLFILIRWKKHALS